MTQNFCPNCGGQNTPGASACAACGTVFASDAADLTVQPPQAGDPQPGYQNYPPAPAAPSVNKNVLIVIGVVLALVFGGLGLFFVLKGPSIEGVVKDFVEAGNERDCDKFADLITGEATELVVEACKDQDNDDGSKAELVSVRNVEIDGDTATAEVKLKVTSKDDDGDVKTETDSDTFGFKKVDGDWKIDLDYDGPSEDSSNDN